MTLEMRTKDGVMIGSITGNTALTYYHHLLVSKYVKKTVKKFVDNGEHTCFVSVGFFILQITDDVEFWLEPNDYIKIKL